MYIQRHIGLLYLKSGDYTPSQIFVKYFVCACIFALLFCIQENEELNKELLLSFLALGKREYEAHGYLMQSRGKNKTLRPEMVERRKQCVPLRKEASLTEEEELK